MTLVFLFGKAYDTDFSLLFRKTISLEDQTHPGEIEISLS